MRTFLALCLSVGTVRRIAERVEKKAAELNGRGIKLAWVPPAQYHVTLQFLGDIVPESVDAIAVAMRRRLSDVPPIGLRLSGLGSFPVAPDTTPRVLWMGVDGGKPLLGLQAAIEADLRELGFVNQREASTSYHPHLTVARVPAEVTLTADDWRGEVGAADAAPIEDVSTEVVVYESRFTAVGGQKSHRGGVEYQARARVPFCKSR